MIRTRDIKYFIYIVVAVLVLLSSIQGVSAGVIIDSDLSQQGYQQDIDTINGVIPGGLAAFAIYARQEADCSAAEIDFSWDPAKGRIHANLSGPVIPDDSLVLNGAESVVLAAEPNVFKTSAGNPAIVRESGGDGQYSISIIRRGVSPAVETNGLLALAVFRLDSAVEWDDTLAIDINVNFIGTDGGVVETAQRTVSIVPVDPSISFITPSGGDTIPAMTGTVVSWECAWDYGFDAVLEFSADGGTEWVMLADIACENGSFAWTPPDMLSSGCLLRIKDESGDIMVLCPAFSIVPAPSITIEAPGETSEGLVPLSCTLDYCRSGELTVRAEFSLDNGETWSAADIDRELSAIPDSGRSFNCMWNALGDAGVVSGTALLKLTPSAGHEGIPAIVPVRLLFNSRPVITGSSGEMTDAAVHVSFTLSDEEGNDIRVHGEYSADNGASWHNATLAGTLGFEGGDYRPGAITWLTWSDFPGVYQRSVLFRIFASDYRDSEPLVLGPYTVNNTGGMTKGTIHKHNPGSIPVFALHNVDYNYYDNEKISLTPTMLRRMVEELDDFGYETLSTGEYVDYVTGGRPVPERSVLLSFDDGYRSMYTRVLPLIQELNCKASFNLILSRLNRSDYLSNDQIRIMQKTGLADFQSHSWNLHTTFAGAPLIDRQEHESVDRYRLRIQDDLEFSMERMVSITGIVPDAFIVPYGRGNGTIETATKDAGLRAMFYIGGELENSYGADPYHLERLSIDRPLSKVVVKLSALGYYAGIERNSVLRNSGAKTEGDLPEILFVKKLDGPLLFSSPAIDSEGNLYVGSWDGTLSKLTPDGDIIWRYMTKWGIVASPAVRNDGVVCIGSYDRYLYLLDKDGKSLNDLDCWDPVFSSAAIDCNGRIYIGSSDGGFIGADTQGRGQWNYRTGDMVIASPAVAEDGTLICASWNNRVLGVNADGSYKWQYSTSSPVESSPALNDDGTVYFGALDGWFYAVSGQNGGLIWKSRLGGRIESSPAIDEDGNLYVGCSDGALYSLSFGGDIRWKYQTGGMVESSPAIDENGLVYFGSRDGCMYAVDSDANLAWRFATAGFIDSSPTISDEGVLYFTSSDSHLYAFDIGAVLADSPWPKFRANKAQTGCPYESQQASPVKDIPLGADDALPRRFELCNPSPNPFNPSTVISFEIPERLPVEVTVYNTAGQREALILSDTLDAGKHTVTWNAGEFPSAVYFVLLRAGNYHDTKKITLLK